LWLRASGLEDAALFRVGLGALDRITGLHVSVWLAAAVCLGAGLAWLGFDRRRPAPRVLLATSVVSFATIGTMIVLKGAFGRLRPAQLLESGDWSVLWFADGGSFPSGHAAFYFGLFLPLVAACRPRWARASLLAVPVFVGIARIDLARHFLSDIAASAFLATLHAWIVASLARRWLPDPERKRT
jgi:membrane-associated phospholipid phosphatase